MIKELSSRVSRADVLPNHYECIIHFIDVQSLNLAKMYLKLAWSEKLIGANHLYLVYMGDMSIFELRFKELFDFKRLIFATSDGVSFLYFQHNYKYGDIRSLQQNVIEICKPHEFLRSKGNLSNVAAWTPKTGL